jgi:hypothetical protein
MLRQKINKKTLLLTLLILVAIGAGVYYFFVMRNSEQEPQIIDTETQTTSEAPSAQSDFTDGDEREPGNTISENEGSAIVEDTGGRDSQNANSNPITSSSGQITVNQPSKNSTIKTGQVLSGTSKLDSVSFRIIDSISGMISTGKLQVVNGKFSGTMKFDTNAGEGRIDVFGTKEDGREFSNINIPVRFE